MVFPFDLGSLKNCKVVLGNRVWAWPFPLSSDWQLAGLGDGIDFETSKLEDGDAGIWPPEFALRDDCSSASEEDVLDIQPEWRERRGSEGYWIPSRQVNVSNTSLQQRPML